MVATSLPGEAEAWGLAALLTFQHARAAARFADAGDLVLLPDQDRSRWDRAADRGRRGDARARGRAALPRAVPAPRRHRGLPRDQPVVGGDRLAPDRDALRGADPARPVAGRPPQPRGGDVADRTRRRSSPRWHDVDELADRLDGYHLFHATRAELLTRLGRDDEAAAANARALALTTNEAERRLLATRLHRHPLTDGS